MPEENDSAKQKASEDAVVDDMDAGGPFVAAVQETRMPMIFSNPRLDGNPIVFANDSFLEMTGYAREEVLGQTYHFLSGPDTDPAAQKEIEAAFAEPFGATYPEVLYYRKDGSTFWSILFIGPIFDENREVVQQFASFVDITQRKEDEKRAKTMLDELDHRVKNTLAIVQAIATRSLQGSDVGERARDAFVGRIRALSRGHTLLARERWEGASLREILEQISLPFDGGRDGMIRVSTDGDDVFLESKAALAFAMLFHELTSNAARYGALSNAGGRIAVVWRKEAPAEGGRLRLRWQERGGPTVAPPDYEGFGSRLIGRMIAYEISGDVSLSFEPGGVVCDVVMPMRAERRA